MSKNTEVKRNDNPVIRYLRETRAELSKVTWPTPQEARNLTVVVLMVVIVMSLFLGFFDAVFQWVFTQLI